MAAPPLLLGTALPLRRAFLLSPSLASGHAARRLWINQRAAEPAALSPADLRRRQPGVGAVGPLAAAARPLRTVRPAHDATGAAPAMSAGTCAMARRPAGALLGARWRRCSTRRGGRRRRPAEQAPFSLSFPARAPSSRSAALCSSSAPCSELRDREDRRRAGPTSRRGVAPFFLVHTTCCSCFPDASYSHHGVSPYSLIDFHSRLGDYGP